MSLSRERMKEYIAEYRNRIIQEAKQYLGNKCNVCGSEQDLEFDHIDPAVKSFTLARNWTRAKADTLAELHKCQLLCAKCHLKKTIAENTIKSECGTTSNYAKGCRCEKCRKAWRENRQRERSKKLDKEMEKHLQNN